MTNHTHNHVTYYADIPQPELSPWVGPDHPCWVDDVPFLIDDAYLLSLSETELLGLANALSQDYMPTTQED
jgi:hypothetical protein